MKLPQLRTKDTTLTKAANLTLRQSLLPLCLVTILFFLWGFAYGLLDVLNKHFQNTLNINRARSSGLQAAYFGAYPIASLTFAGYTLRHAGYKATFMLGLTLYGVGALLFWPSAVKRSFGGFCGATFVIGSGLGTLETAANPYLAVCGPPKYSELRLNIAQAFQAVGTVVGPILASHVFFKDTSSDSLESVQYVYLGIACFVFVLAAVFYISNIPEITDADMQEQLEATGDFADTEGGSIWTRYTLWWAVLAQGCYCGAQVAIAGYFINYVVDVRPQTPQSTASNFLAIAQGCFAIGRFTGSGLMKFIKPRKAFMMYFTGVIVTLSVAIGVRGNAAVAFLCLTLFFESIIFPTIFALGIRGLGVHTKKGASYIIAAIIGGAIVPPLTGVTADAFDNTGHAFFVPQIFFLVAITFAIACNWHPRTKAIMDGFHDSKVGVVDPESGGLKVVVGGKSESDSGDVGEEKEKALTVEQHEHEQRG